MKELSLNHLKRQRKKLNQIGNKNFGRERKEKVRSEIQKKWLKENNKLEAFISIFSVLIVYVVGYFMLKLMVNVLGDNYQLHEEDIKFQMSFVRVVWAVFGVILIFGLCKSFLNFKNKNFEEYLKEQLEIEREEYKKTFVLKKEDLKPFYETLEDYYGKEVLLNKIETRLKGNMEDLGNLCFLDRLYKEIIEAEKLNRKNIAEREVLERKIKAIKD